jgi:hypothetical protein
VIRNEFRWAQLRAGLLRLRLLLLLLPIVSCATFDFRAMDRSCGPPRFPYTAGWLGGDAAYSIPLPNGKSVWLFGDTFVGTPDQQTRAGSTFIHNSIAISECLRSGEWKIQYAWGRGKDGTAHAFLDPGEKDAYWWLFDGFLHEDQLYIGLLRVTGSEPRGPLNLPFSYQGMGLARIENPKDAPVDWRIEILPLSEGAVALPGSTMVVHGDHVYLFTFLDLDAEHYPRMLARFPLVALDLSPARPVDSLEYLAKSGEWKPGLDPSDGKVLMEDNASEMSVRYHPEIGRWVAVYNYPNLTDAFPEIPPSDRIYIRTAGQLKGPWSEPKSIYRIPELDESYAAGHDPNTFCYAAKEHPEYAREGRLLFTYVCNLFTPSTQDPLEVMKRLAVKMHLYRPIAVSIPFPSVQVE